MTANAPAWPCRHSPPCYSEAQHWEVCGLDYPDDCLNDPVCADCGWPGCSCSCHEMTDDEENRWPIARDEIIVKQKPGYVVVQVAEETLRAIRHMRRCDEAVDIPDSIVDGKQAIDACEAIDNLAAASEEAWELIFRDLGDALSAGGE